VNLMEVDELFNKLKPVLGKRIKELWLEYHLNPKSRAEIEGMLNALASRYLDNNFERKSVILAPPNEELISGEYFLGTVYFGRKPYMSFGLREEEWIQHVGIFGRTGSGKTNVGFLIVKNLLEKEKPFLIFDWKRNYRDILSLPLNKDVFVFTIGRNISPFCFNPLIPPKGTQPTIWLKKLIEIMCHVYWLGEGVAYLLQKAIDKVYEDAGVYYGDVKKYPTLADVKEWLEKYKARGREAQWMDSTIRVIGTLCYGEIGKVLNVRKSIPIESLLKGNVIFELDALTNSDKTFLIESLLLWIHHFRLQEPERETFKHAILIEEAHHVLLKKKESKETVMDIILREIRELGESIILIDQHPSLISIPSLGNTYCTIAMNLKHNRDVSTIGEAMLLESKDRDFLGKLEVGFGIVKLQGRWFKPFLVKFPLVEVKKGSVTDEDLKRRMLGYSNKFQDVSSTESELGEIPAIPDEDKMVEDKYKVDLQELSEEQLSFVMDVYNYPVSSLTDRFKRLGFTVRRGFKILSFLFSFSFLSSHYVSTGKGRIRFLELEEKGKQYLEKIGYKINRKREGGPEHEYWKHKVAEHFRKQGYEIESEYPIGEGGTVDIVASKDGKGIAIEIETGKSDAIENIEKDLAAGFEQIYAFALSKTVKNEIESLLKQTNWDKTRIKVLTLASLEQISLA